MITTATELEISKESSLGNPHETYIRNQFLEDLAKVQGGEMTPAEFAETHTRRYLEVERKGDKDGLCEGLWGGKRVFAEFMEQQMRIARRNKTPLTLIRIDMDGLKQLNDKDGHNTADLVIKKVGEVLLFRRRASDIVIREGGDEFALILSETNQEGAEEATKRIQNRLKEIQDHPEIDESKIGFPKISHPQTLTIGIAEMYPEGLDTPENLSQRADDALMTGKEDRRGSTTIYHPDDPKIQTREATRFS